LVLWAGRRRAGAPGRGVLRFAVYGRVSTEDGQDPVTSRARQLEQAGVLVAGHGQIVAGFSDSGHRRALPWARRPQAAALVAALADPDRGWDAIVIGEYERAFYGNQYAAMAPLFEHCGVQLRMPEAGGRVDWHAEDHEQAMLALGWSSRREITRTRIRVRAAMAAQTREQGRYLGGRPPYGYRLADAGSHPDKAHAARGRRAHRLEPDPITAPAVRWMFARRLAGHRVARITRALNDAGISCPSAADPGRNPHPQRRPVDAADGSSDLGRPPAYRAAGAEPAAHRLRPGRPGQHRAGAQAGPAVEPARRPGDLCASRASGAGQRGRLYRRLGGDRATRPGGPGGAPVPARAPVK
jgi:DNA invertase Pin-like site-specific DNA recombinase